MWEVMLLRMRGLNPLNLSSVEGNTTPRHAGLVCVRSPTEGRKATPDWSSGIAGVGGGGGGGGGGERWSKAQSNTGGAQSEQVSHSLKTILFI